jgi:bifunctional non-homologous end joining protein LigD
MSLRERTRPGLGIIEPCLPSRAKIPPSGPGWIHEIKHDGFRILARRDSAGVRLVTRARNDFSGPLSVYRNGGRQTAGSLVLDRR